MADIAVESGRVAYKDAAAQRARVLGAFKVMTPMLHGFDNSEHFAVMYIVITFGRQTFARPECYRMQYAVMGLTDDSGDCSTR